MTKKHTPGPLVVQETGKPFMRLCTQAGAKASSFSRIGLRKRSAGRRMQRKRGGSQCPPNRRRARSACGCQDD